ncbi:hypothetical protein [Pseudomonas syringae]|uniref:hypothetical protein n=1 Tax=Pseudomonas syringae TaxID=317 RepID=UPI001F203A48|nr:hypothetical protein [Pseudomonas syringae]MCF5703632.1 hypothetical protein [Pseudomonas syringae]
MSYVGFGSRLLRFIEARKEVEKEVLTAACNAVEFASAAERSEAQVVEVVEEFFESF